MEVLGTDPETVDGFIKHVKTCLRENSILGGHVISFTANDYPSSAAGITFHRRTPVAVTELFPGFRGVDAHPARKAPGKTTRNKALAALLSQRATSLQPRLLDSTPLSSQDTAFSLGTRSSTCSRFVTSRRCKSLRGPRNGQCNDGWIIDDSQVPRGQ